MQHSIELLDIGPKNAHQRRKKTWVCPGKIYTAFLYIFVVLTKPSLASFKSETSGFSWDQLRLPRPPSKLELKAASNVSQVRGFATRIWKIHGIFLNSCSISCWLNRLNPQLIIQWYAIDGIEMVSSFQSDQATNRSIGRSWLHDDPASGNHALPSAHDHLSEFRWNQFLWAFVTLAV